VRLADLQAEAERVHPEIRAAERMVEVKRLRVPQAKSLPDPTVGVGWMGNITPFDVQNGDPSSYRAITAMQELPYPGKLRLRGEVMQKDADAEQWNVEAARRRVRAEVAAAFYGLWATDKALGITRRNKDLLEKFSRIAEEKYKVGSGIQQDVLRAHVEVTRLLQRITVLDQQRRTFEAQLNSLLLRPMSATIEATADVEKTLLPYTLDELLDRAVASAPEIRRQEEMIEQSRVAINLAQREYYPDFNVGYMYQQRPAMPDMHGFTFGVKIPVFYRSKQRKAVEEAASTLAGTQQMREAIRTTLLFQVKEQFLAARASEELLTLYSKGIVPQSSLALESALVSYQTGELDFLSVIKNFVTVLDYEIAYYQELASYQKALARLEEITGLDLTAPAGAGE
jgi:outer membrane protein TolC